MVRSKSGVCKVRSCIHAYEYCGCQFECDLTQTIFLHTIGPYHTIADQSGLKMLWLVLKCKNSEEAKVIIKLGINQIPA